ncbi:MAG: hypothetical protein ACR2QE_00550 [Acidimicrobiales bacterium]
MPTPAAAHVIAARRTPFGVVHGLLSGWHPVDLLAHTLTITCDDAGIDPADVDAMLVGCAHPVGAQAANVGRAAILSAGWPEAIPATTIERGASSSHRALQLAAHTVTAGGADVVIAAGVEVMSLVPAGAVGLNRQYGPIWGNGPAGRYAAAGGLVPPGVAGDRLALADGYGRAVLDDEAARCRLLAATVDHPPWLVVAPTRLNDRDQPRAALTVMVDDEAPTSPIEEDCAPLHDNEGQVAASNLAPAADGAAVAVLASDRWLARTGREAHYSVVSSAETAVDPVTMFGAGVAAARQALGRADIAPTDLHSVELDAPHSAAALHAVSALGVDPDRTNRSGGSLGRGRPLGAVGVGMLAETIGWDQHHQLEPTTALLVDEADDGTGAATVLRKPIGLS